MLSLFAVLLLVVGTINGVNIYQSSQKSQSLLEMLSNNGGTFPQGDMSKKQMLDTFEDEMLPGDAEANQDISDRPHQMEPSEEQVPVLGFRMSAETPFETRYFSVTVDDGGNQSIDVSHVASVSEEEAQKFAADILESQKTDGYIGQYRYRATQTEEGTLLVFLDCRNDIQNIKNFALISLLVGAVCILLVLILVVVLSKHAIRPLIESTQKQKQFITDAGHEIKTPIAIISANTEVLEMCDGENEWTVSIHRQVNRLNELVKNLLTLSKLDEMQEKLPMAEFCVGKLLQEVCGSFEAVWQTKEISITRQIDEKLCMSGDENSIRHLISILVDNAVKYANTGGGLSVEAQGTERHIILSIFNTCESVPDGDLTRLFDRFYRADSSRSRESGGYGIGLSVAAAIVHAHKGKIEAVRREDGICFQVTLPGRIKNRD